MDQFDIEYLHLLLNTEISSIHNAEIGIIRQVEFLKLIIILKSFLGSSGNFRILYST